jgi:hypothetical protein
VNDAKYGPKGQMSPTLGSPCAICGAPFAIGDFTTLVRTSDEGRYSNDSVEVHWECAHPLRAQLCAAI